MMRKKKRENQTVRTALTTLLLSHHLVPRVTVATKMHPRCDRILTVRKGIFLEVETRRCASTPSSPVARHDETATLFSSAPVLGRQEEAPERMATCATRARHASGVAKCFRFACPKPQRSDPPSAHAPRRAGVPAHGTRGGASDPAVPFRFACTGHPPENDGGWAGWSPGDSAPRPRAVAGLRPEPAGWRSASASASHPRAGDGERVHAARPCPRRCRRSNAPQIFGPFAWPGIARERFPRSSCSSSLPYHPGQDL